MSHRRSETPRNRSGAMYRKVPTTSCDCDRSSPSSNFARPKSVTQTLPTASRSRFDGLMSRCSTPRLWAYARASATWAPRRATSRW